MLRYLFLLLNSFTRGPFLGWLDFFIFELNMIGSVVTTHSILKLLFSPHQVRKQRGRSVDNLRNSGINIVSKSNPWCTWLYRISSLAIWRSLCVRFSALAHDLAAIILDAFEELFLLLVIHAEVLVVIIIVLEDICRKVVIYFILLIEFIL